MRISEARLQKTFHVNPDSKYKDVHVCMKNIYSVMAGSSVCNNRFIFFALWDENKTVTGKLN